ncbi:sugar-binding transcriptional regulator [Lutibacter sp. B2]|nr:sugar-binding transcriptional regulator [Lutibacter sp. B2]
MSEKKDDYDFLEIVEIQRRLLPELTDVLMKRYNLLRLIHYHQPIGRRSLSQQMNIGERMVRSEVNMLKEQGFIEIKPQGMNTTEFGENSLEVLRNFIRNYKKLYELEKLVAKKLGIKKVLIASGNYDEDKLIIGDVGNVASKYLKTILKDNMVVGITGGNTMKMLAQEMSKGTQKPFKVTVVPGRGGLGKDVSKQANAIAANLAQKLKASYKILHMADNISRELLNTLMEDPYTKEVIEYINKIETFAFGIGRADKMANRRGLSKEKIVELSKHKAVAEAFGYYFNKNGQIVQEANTIGVSLKHYKRLEYVIGAAVGSDKAEAIVAISKLNNNLVLVIDEGLAIKILDIIT